MKVAAVTGAAGFIGGHLCRALAFKGVSVIGCDSRRPMGVPGPSGGRGGYSFVECDITRRESLGFVKEADTVFHLAAISNPRRCQEDFCLAFQVNVEGTKNVLEACGNGSRAVFLSGAMVYGEPLYLPFNEDHPLRGQDPYSVTKILGEYLCRAYARLKGLRITIVRNFNTYGPGQSPEYVVASLISQARTQGKIEVWDTSTSRNFTYVDDTVEALLRIADSESLVGEVVNLGSDQEVSIGMLAEEIARLFGGLPVVDLKKGGVGGGRQMCDSNKLQQRTGWQPRVSLKEGLRRTASHLEEMGGFGKGNKTAN